MATGAVDIVLLGDVDQSLVQLARDGVLSHAVTKDGYVPLQDDPGASTLDELTIPPLGDVIDRPDLVPGYVWVGRGCAFSCFYCLENREDGQRVLGRANARLRSAAAVARDAERLSPRTQLIFDYEHPSPTETLAFVEDLCVRKPASFTSCYYFCWGLPSDDLLEVLSSAFAHVAICLDVQVFGERLRERLAKRALIKPFFPDEAIRRTLACAESKGNVLVDATGVVGMPLESSEDREAGLSAIERASKNFDCVRDWRFSPLHVIPGTVLSRSPRFQDLEVQRRGFDDFLTYTRESYLAQRPYYSPDRRSHPWGVFPSGQPNAIVHFMMEAERRLEACREAARRITVDRSNSDCRIQLSDPFAPLPSLLDALEREAQRPAQRLSVSLGPLTWFHGSWLDYTSESGENSAIRSDLGHSAAGYAAAHLVGLLRAHGQVRLESPDAPWGVVELAAQAAAGSSGRAEGLRC